MIKRTPTPLSYLQSTNDEPLSGIGPGAGYAFAHAYFPKAEETLRIATAYFSIRGYDLGRKFFKPNVQIQFLVGKRDGVLVQEAVRNEIKNELSRGDSGDLYDAVVDLVERIRKQQFQIKDAREMYRPFHCKFYISDDKVLWHGSANFSKKGLLEQAEQVTASEDPILIKNWTEWFDEVASNAKDLLQEILDDLERWLKMATPFEAYIKSLYLIFDLAKIHFKRGALQPVYYQISLIAWALHQIKENSGALMVVGTGLGKTVIGAEIAGRLNHSKEISSVILLAPSNVHKEWRKQLKLTREVPVDVFDNSILFRSATEANNKISELIEELENVDHRSLIIIDEAHKYRNQLLNRKFGENSIVLGRLEQATKQGAKVLLLTGSAYGTNIQNLNSLLEILPSNHETGEKLSVKSPDDFITLKQVCILGIPHVLKMARQRQDFDEKGNLFIKFADVRKYLPTQLLSKRILFKPPLLHETLNAFDNDCFRQNKMITRKSYDDDLGEVTAPTDTAQLLSLKSWLSSPLAFRKCLIKNIATPGKESQLILDFNAKETVILNYIQVGIWSDLVRTKKGTKPSKRINTAGLSFKTDFKLNQSIRCNYLDPIIERLANDKIKDDKLDKLTAIVTDRCLVEKASVIVFVDLHLTALYLEKQLKSRFKKLLRIACTVRSDGKELKSPSERKSIIEKFSPEANGSCLPAEFEVLICTDADGIGINMQDADTIINYDLSGGADVLVQRLGRILRPTKHSSRIPHIYTFEPEFIIEENTFSNTINVFKRQQARLRKRHDKSSAILSNSILGINPEEELPLDGDVDLEKLYKKLGEVSLSKKQASIAEQITILEGYRDLAGEISEKLFSAKYYKEEFPRLVVLFRYNNLIHSIIFNVETNTIESSEELEALQWLQCAPNEPRAPVKEHHILHTANEALKCWGETKGVDTSLTERLVTLYLLPIEGDHNLQQFISRNRKR